MKALAEYAYPDNVLDVVGPLVQILERGLVRDAEVFIAGLALWVLRRLQERTMSPDRADQVFTLLDVYFTDDYRGPPLSEEAQELLFEGELFHHFGEPDGPNPQRLTALASAIFERAEQASNPKA